RINNGDWNYVPGRHPGTMVKAPTSKTREAFRPYNLDSYANGEMGFSIAERDIVPPSKAEILEMTERTERLQTLWGFGQMGVDENTAKEILNAQAERFSIGMSTGAFGADYQ